MIRYDIQHTYLNEYYFEKQRECYLFTLDFFFCTVEDGTILPLNCYQIYASAHIV